MATGPRSWRDSLPAMPWSPKAWISSRREARSSSRAARHPERAFNERFARIHSAASGDVAFDAGDRIGGACGLSPVAGIGPARGGLPHDSGDDFLSGREPRCDGLVGDRAPRTPVRPGSGIAADYLHELP